MSEPQTSLERGAALIKSLAKSLPEGPGVYRMLDKSGEPLYVGKARALKKRVRNYTNPERLSLRMQRMVAQTYDMVFVHTHTEAEALLLESNLIKKLKPRYNVLLRDDKSFPYIHITGNHDFPLLTKHRGARTGKGHYFGPFASGQAVNRTLTALQKAFMLRNCSDSVFAQRKRPCLQYHIKRCTAPCVGKVTKEEYAKQVDEACRFLSGGSHAIQEKLAQEMEEASAQMEYERAAKLRDRIKALTEIQARQDINLSSVGDADFVGLWREGGMACVQVFFFRDGRNFGNRPYFLRHDDSDTDTEILEAFLAQFYENKSPARHVYVSHKLENKVLLEQALASRRDDAFAVTLHRPSRGVKKRLMDFVLDNAAKALARERLKVAGEDKALRGLAALCGLEERPQRIEVYDNSHIGGTNMVGAMIVAGSQGFEKSAYRKFNIRTAAASDDYGMMREVIRRRFSKTLKSDDGPGGASWPDILIIDGGKGQLASVVGVLDDLGIADEVEVLAVSKGPERRAGDEIIYRKGYGRVSLDPRSDAFHYIQRVRDEAHRFAIGSHRARRVRQISKSPLDTIAGIGPKRKKALLHHFGSAKAVSRAGLHDLEAVEGISAEMARRIYEYFHEN